MTALPLMSRREISGSPIGRVLEVGVSPTASTTVGDNELVAVLRHVFDNKACISVDHERSRGNEHDDVVASFAVSIRAHAMGASLGSPLLLVGK